MPLSNAALCIILGICPLLWLPTLPSQAVTMGTIFVAAGFCLLARRGRVVGLALLCFCWGVLFAHQMVTVANTLADKSFLAEVQIMATDGATRHVAKVISVNGARQFPAPGIMLYGQALSEKPCAGQLWHMKLKTRAVHGQLNEGMFDSQRHAISQHLPLTGRFDKADVVDSRCNFRTRFVSPLSEKMKKYPWGQVMLALAVGERTAVAKEVNTLLQQTGTAHLLAISGLHVSLVALLGYWIVRAGQALLPCRRIDWRIPLIGGFIAAAVYSWLSGFHPPAQRTLLAAGCWLLLRLSGRYWKAWEVWQCCIAMILVFDPLAILAQSLWLSAFAVAALIYWYQWMPYRQIAGGRIVNALWGLLHLQLGLTVLLLPLQILSFHGVSITSVPANMVAVPLVTFIEIPLLLVGMVLHCVGLEIMSDAVWSLADRVLALLFRFLALLPEGWFDVDQRWQWMTLLPWMALPFWRLSGWRHWPGVGLACCVMLAYPLWRKPPTDRWALTMLDVGQGLAMVITRNGKAMLYDTGLAWPEGDSAQQLIVPWLRWHHLQPEGIILSHEHRDHRGGLETLKKVWPALSIRSPLLWKEHQPCFRGERWHWQGLTFQALWPLPESNETGNNRSCVVRIDDGHFSVLLTGDIETPAEMLMMSHYWQHLASTLVQVPHHGSATSSSAALLRRIGGSIAMSSAARYNAWHFPSASVKMRYLEQKYQWLDTAHQGQITVVFSPDGWQIQRLRDQIFRRWYHPWFGDTRDNG